MDVMLGGAWVEKATLVAPDPLDCLQVDPAGALPRPGRYFLRARAENANGDPVAANLALTVTKGLRLGVINEGGAVGGEQYLYTTTPDKAVTVDAQARGQSIDLQRRSGTQWLHVGGCP